MYNFSSHPSRKAAPPSSPPGVHVVGTITEAIVTLKERNGSPRSHIKAQMKATHGEEPSRKLMSAALKKPAFDEDPSSLRIG